MQKIIKYIKKPEKIIIYLMNKNFFFFLPDKLYLKLKFKLIMGKTLNLDNPQTFNEKLQWLKLYDRNPEYTKMVDKAKVKECVGKIIGYDKIIKTLGVYDCFEEIDFTKLPNQFVLKPTHASGNVFICKDKTKIDIKKLKKTTKKWLRRNYYKIHREWPYKNVKPKLIIEEYMKGINSGLNDYKFFMFNGKLAYYIICSDREKSVKFTFFDKDNNFINVTQDGCNNDHDVKKPNNFNEMIILAEKLSKDIYHVRVDFYEINDKIYFGELTFFDSAGFGKFEPEEWDYRFGNMLKLPMENKNEK